MKPAKAVRPEKCFGAPVLEEGLCFVVGAGCFGFKFENSNQPMPIIHSGYFFILLLFLLFFDWSNRR